MTLEELRELIAERMKRDPRLRAILKRIEAGKATAQDSFTYSRIAAEIMADELSGAVLSLDDREAVCTALLRDRYDDTVTQADAVQRILDAKSGLHMQPRRPAFPAERVQQIAHSLVQPDVSDEKIVRRAGSTATVAMSFHDDFVQENAKFRSRAGLKCYITRVTDGKCCAWCAKLAGRYEYGEEPEEVYHRHDNCGCTVTYENGRKRQDVWSKREWEAPEEGAGAGERVVLTEEQAKALQEKHGLTYGRKPAIIKNIELPPETDQIRSMSAETKQLVSDAIDKIMGMYEVQLDQLITEPIYEEDGKTIAKTVPFQFQPRRGQDGEIVKCLVINSMYDFRGSQDEMQQHIMRNFNNKALASNSIEGLIAHELAHIMTFQSEHSYSGLLQTNKRLTKAFEILSESCDLSEISLYAAMKSDVSEVIAEAFVKVLRGEAIPEPVMPYLNEYIERWRK